MIVRVIVALTIVLGTAGFMLAVLLRGHLRYTRTGKLQLALAVVVSVFVTQHAMLLLIDPEPRVFELSRTVMLLSMAVVVGSVLYDRHAKAYEAESDG